MESEKKYLGGWWMLILLLIVLSSVIFGVLNMAGLIGKTVVERVVFEQSFQYSEGMKQRAAVLEANIAEIDMLIATGQGDQEQLLAQKSVLRVQLNAIKK